MSENELYRVISAFEAAGTAVEYHAAKLRMGGLPALAQMALVDSARAARKRLTAAGVTL